MRYLVPQFITREVKIVGPLTFRQFAFVGGAAGICFVLYAFIENLFLLALVCIPIMGAGFALAFYKYHGVPLPEVILHFFGYLFQGHVFLWKKKAIVPEAYKMPEYKPEEEKEPERITTRTRSQLEDLSTKIETKH